MEKHPATRSGHPRFREFKARLCEGLSLDLSGVSTPCEPGLVSIVLPVFNGAGFVAEAIDSVFAQTWGNWELIVVDDGSTDETPWILNQYRADSRVRVMRQDNRKLPAALNAGFTRARGEFYTWISADNRLRPEALARMVAFLKAEPSIAMVYANKLLIGDDGSLLRDSPYYRLYQRPAGSGIVHLPPDPGELNFAHNNYVGACFLYRAWAAKMIGPYDEGSFGFEDYDYWLRMNALFRMEHLGATDSLYEYRFHNTSLTARAEELRITERAANQVHCDALRREYFLEPFDITFAGRHAWIGHLAGVYRAAGNHVLELPEAGPDELYQYRVSRAFRKAILISSGFLDPLILETGQHIFHGVLEDNRLHFGKEEIAAASPSTLEYPILAAANSLLRNDCLFLPESTLVPDSAPEISLVICTHNRVDLLPRCIEAARRQTLDAGRFEIVVVDNASTDSTAALLRRFEDVRSVYCAEQGLSNARNLGVLAARAPIVAYIDDDAIADPDLLEKLLEAYRTHPDAGCVGGRIDVMLPPTLPGWYTPEFEGYYSAYTPRENKIHRLRDIADFPYGANLSFRKEALERIGMFRTKLGRVGRNQSGGEEIDAESRIAKLGYGVYCQPAARVEHVILPARLDWPHIENSARAAGRNWAHYEHEGLYPKQPLSADLRAWREARERMRRAGRQTFPHSQEIFHRAKWLRKLRSRLPPV